MDAPVVDPGRPSPRAGIAAGVVVLTGVIAGWSARSGARGVVIGAVLGALSVGAGWPDLVERRIPNRVVLAGAAGGLAVAVAGGTLGAALAGATVAGGPLFVLHLLRPDGVGFGDVKLAAVVGSLLACVRWPLAAFGLAAAALGGLVGAALWPTWRRSIPFGTCLGAGSLLVLALSPTAGDVWGLW